MTALAEPAPRLMAPARSPPAIAVVTAAFFNIVCAILQSAQYGALSPEIAGTGAGYRVLITDKPLPGIIASVRGYQADMTPDPLLSAGTQQFSPFGLPATVQACLFDLDGVLTQTEKLHAQAWKQMFDKFLQARAQETSNKFVPFTLPDDYAEYVDGMPRAVGTRTFLRSRGITLPEGSETDPPTAVTIQGLSNRKNEIVQQLISRQGVDVYERSVGYVRMLRSSGMRCAVVSSSANARLILHRVRIDELFDGCVDGTDVEREHLSGKPAPDTYLAGARLLGAPAADTAIFDDALAGVQAGRAGGFGFVVGVDRTGRGAELRSHGADAVVSDLADLLAAA